MKIQMKFASASEVPEIYIDGERLNISEFSKSYGITGNLFSFEANYPKKENSDPSILSGLSFGLAIDMVKKGHKIQRAGWNGKNQYVELATYIRYVNANGIVMNAEHAAIGNAALAFVGTSGVQLGWLASQADMLAEDWRIVE